MSSGFLFNIQDLPIMPASCLCLSLVSFLFLFCLSIDPCCTWTITVSSAIVLHSYPDVSILFLLFHIQLSVRCVCVLYHPSLFLTSSLHVARALSLYRLLISLVWISRAKCAVIQLPSTPYILCSS